MKKKLKLIRSLTNIPDDFPGCVATIGNFDGIHRGHQTLLMQLLQKSKELGLPSVLITFEPQPNEFFAQSNQSAETGEVLPLRLMRFREKWRVLQQFFPLDYVCCLRFNQKMASFSPQLFVQKILVEKLKIAYMLVGDDFHFGYQRAGNITTLKQEGERWHFGADSIPTYKLAGREERVSSSLVRLALQAGDMEKARALLGRNYAISGQVIHGDKRGHTIGFPTANIFIHHKAVPLKGVYAVKVHGLSIDIIMGIANIGTRPTVDGMRRLLEVHLFDFDRDIYGEFISVEFVKKLRDEKRYDSFELLRQQILKDANEARDFLESAGVSSAKVATTKSKLALHSVFN